MVKKEVTKLLAAGIIYPILYDQWVVPKKSGMTVMKNQHDKLVPMQIQNNWRVYIDYRRLNQATCKDHFPLPFIDKVLEKLAGKSHYCFLDGFFGYMQIHIALEDQHKTTFTPIQYLCVHTHAVWPMQCADKIALPLSKLLQKDVDFEFDQPCIEAFQELKNQLTSAPILQAPNWELPFEFMCDVSNSKLGAV
ncbi:Retrovirus-related Pol polyprotein from transposon gypsy, partial [Mucuna pruriens]